MPTFSGWLMAISTRRATLSAGMACVLRYAAPLAEAKSITKRKRTSLATTRA